MATRSEIQLIANNHKVLPRGKYISELPTTDISQYANRNQLANIKDLQRTNFPTRSWIVDLGASSPTGRGVFIAKIATELATSFTEVLESTQSSKLYNKKVRYLENRPIGIRYAQPPGGRKAARIDELSHYRLICVAGAGFATLHGDRIIESNVTIFGKALFRDCDSMSRISAGPSVCGNSTGHQIFIRRRIPCRSHRRRLCSMVSCSISGVADSRNIQYEPPPPDGWPDAETLRKVSDGYKIETGQTLHDPSII